LGYYSHRNCLQLVTRAVLRNWVWNLSVVEVLLGGLWQLGGLCCWRGSVQVIRKTLTVTCLICHLLLPHRQRITALTQKYGMALLLRPLSILHRPHARRGSRSIVQPCSYRQPQPCIVFTNTNDSDSQFLPSLASQVCGSYTLVTLCSYTTKQASRTRFNINI
jgi:hypothetical protein